MITDEKKDISLIKKYKIKSYEVTQNNELKPFALLHYFEDVAYLNAESYGFGHSVTSAKNLYWFVVKYHLKFEELPQAWEKIKIKTWPRKNGGIQCLRDFEIYSEDGRKTGVASSAWVLVSVDSKRPVNPFKTLEFPNLPEEKALETSFEKIPPVLKVDYEKTFEIRFDDLDINRHVNNANYIAWATETLPYDFRVENSLAEVEIQYKKECTYGMVVLSQVEYDEEKNITLHSLKNAASLENLCDIRIRWKKV